MEGVWGGTERNSGMATCNQDLKQNYLQFKKKNFLGDILSFNCWGQEILSKDIGFIFFCIKIAREG